MLLQLNLPSDVLDTSQVVSSKRTSDGLNFIRRQKYANNPKAKAKARERTRLWRIKNPERAKANSDKWYILRRDSYIAKLQKWKLENPAKVKAYRKKFYAEHKEEISSGIKKWNKENPDRKRQSDKAWLSRHPGFAYAYHKKWAAKNRASINAMNARRRARKICAPGYGYTTMAHISDRWRVFDGKCWICGVVATETDHVKPLSKGGSHWPSNLRPICGSCNPKKNNVWPFDINKIHWAQEKKQFNRENSI